jgi:hypothetical protein
MPQTGTTTRNQEIRILIAKAGIGQQGTCNIRSDHPVPHLNQSLILPKQTMRDKRFADRIATISTGFCRKSVSSTN